MATNSEAVQPAAEAAHIRRIESKDDAQLARIIRETLREFGVCGPGTSEQDPQIDSMTKAYGNATSAYFVAERNGSIIGGCGIAPLLGGDKDTCELQKMYLILSTRGQGIGRRLMQRCLEAAREIGYRHCYLETRSEMHDAHRLYRAAGFQECSSPMGATGHWGCDKWFVKEF